MAKEGWVTMYHPDLPQTPPSDQPLATYNEHYAIKGWKILDPVAVKAGELLGKDVRDINDLSEVELTTLAARAGVEVKEKAKPGEIKSAVAEALKPAEQEGAA